MAHVRGYTRKVKGKLVRVRGFTRRNPGEGEESYMTGYPYQNPNMLDTFTRGSSVTQDVGGLDLLAGAISFLVNDQAVKMIGLRGWSSVLGAGIVPFISSAIVAMIPGWDKLGSPVFFGGQLNTTLRLADKLSQGRIGLSEGGQLEGLSGLGLPLLTAGATQLSDRRVVNFPQPSSRARVMGQ